jgi:D-glycero-D-manno-heptose 1,7-bisphosphate phosphatase
VKFRHVILDRDGVLNREAPAGGYILHPDDFHWLPRALQALSLLHKAGLRLTVATNQSAIGRGLMGHAELAAIHRRMLRDAAAVEGDLDAVFYCPHAPDEGCDCRKPAPGLIRQAVEASGISRAETLVVGDDVRDLEAAAAAGVSAALVLTGKGRQAQMHLARLGMTVSVYKDLLAAAHDLVGGMKHLSPPDRRESEAK